MAYWKWWIVFVSTAVRLWRLLLMDFGKQKQPLTFKKPSRPLLLVTVANTIGCISDDEQPLVPYCNISKSGFSCRSLTSVLLRLLDSFFPGCTYSCADALANSSSCIISKPPVPVLPCWIFWGHLRSQNILSWMQAATWYSIIPLQPLLATTNHQK